MKASELRIGNLLLFSNKIQPNRIVTVGRRFFSSASIEKEDGDFEITQYYQPISLTEDWLMKFGFWSKYKSVHNHWCKNDKSPKVKAFSLDQKSDVDDEHNSVPQEQVFYYDYSLEVQYVHQLQNLYFALTGEELTLNE